MDLEIKREARTILANPDSRFSYFAWPTVARMPDGSLAVVCSGYRCGHICPFGKAVLSVSEDGGETWSGPAPVIDTPLDDRDAGITAFGDNGVIVTSFNNSRAAQRNWNPVREDLPPEINRRNAFYLAYVDTVTDEEEERYLGATFRLSKDGGKTFGPVLKSPVTSPHGPTETADGRLIWVGRRFSADDAFPEGEPTIAAYEVSAAGEMTYLGEVPAVVRNGAQADACEPHAIELEDGSLLCHFRVEGNGLFTLYQTVSADGGRTWSEPEQLLADDGGAPAHLLEHSSGALISVYGFRRGPDYGIRVMVSRDLGRTWDKDGILWETRVSSDLGYPATVELDDGTLLTVFYAKDSESAPAVIKAINWSLT